MIGSWTVKPNGPPDGIGDEQETEAEKKCDDEVHDECSFQSLSKFCVHIYTLQTAIQKHNTINIPH